MSNKMNSTATPLMTSLNLRTSSLFTAIGAALLLCLSSAPRASAQGVDELCDNSYRTAGLQS